MTDRITEAIDTWETWQYGADAMHWAPARPEGSANRVDNLLSERMGIDIFSEDTGGIRISDLAGLHCFTDFQRAMDALSVSAYSVAEAMLGFIPALMIHDELNRPTREKLLMAKRNRSYPGARHPERSRRNKQWS